MAIGFYEAMIISSDDLLSTTKLWKNSEFSLFKNSLIISSDDLLSTTKLWKNSEFSLFKSARLAEVSKGHPVREYGR